MEYEIEGRSVVKLQYSEGENTSKHLNTNINLSISKNLDRKGFFNENDLPNKEGVKALTQAFVQGLVGNIHYAHQKGYWNDYEHLRYIIKELERGFMSNANVYDSNFTS